MAELFGVPQQNINYHLSQIEESGELHLSDTYKKNVIFGQMVSHTSIRTCPIETQSFSDYVKSNCKENTYVHAQRRDHWYGSGDV